jgi:hypothetical protein
MMSAPVVRRLVGAAVLASVFALPLRRASADGDVDVRFYGDTGYSVYSSTSASKVASPDLFPSVSNSFAASHFEIFPTASYDRLSFLAEVMFESDAESNNFSIDVERIQVMYLFSDALRLKAGRVHTAFGYYNDAYHHARLFDLTTGRPYLTNFEDSGGIIPAHIVGVGADGKLPLRAAGDFTYNLDVGNARSPDITEVPVAMSAQGEKAVNLRLRFLPRFVEGLIVGVNGMYDDVPAGTPAVVTGGVVTTPGVGSPDHLEELDLGAHVVYVEGRSHFIVEGAYILHHDFQTGVDYTNYGGFAEAGYSFGDFTPYARYELFQFDRAGDPLFQSPTFLLGCSGCTLPLATGRLEDWRAGVKWLPDEHIALKLEGRGLKTDLGAAQYSGTLQCAFGF